MLGILRRNFEKSCPLCPEPPPSFVVFLKEQITHLQRITKIMSSTTTSTSEYLLIFRGTDWDRSLSPAELQKTMASFLSWFERLNAQGTLKAGQPLMDEARIVSGKNGRSVAD